MKCKAKRLHPTLEHRLSMYALAAGAAGVGILALADAAEAKIIYRPTHVVIANNEAYHLDLNHDHITDFTLWNSFSSYFKGYEMRILGVPSYKNLVAGFRSGYNREHFAYALNRGARIPIAYGKYGAALGGATLVGARRFGTGYRYQGYWENVRDHYLGLQFQIDGKIHYGWARLTVKVHKLTVVGTLTGYAYETIPNKPIIAGKTKGSDVITLQPASLGALAAGANGLGVWRKK